jgi:hypothetical protein
MAKKKQTQNGKPAVETLPLKVILDPTDDTPSYYANYAEATFAPHECALYFARVPTKLGVDRTDEARAAGTLRIDPSMQIVFGPTLLPGLIRALTTIKGAYETTFGPIRDETPENE